MPSSTVGILWTSIGNLKDELIAADETGFSFIVTPLFPPDGTGLPVPDTVLRSTEWSSQIMGLIDCTDLDAPVSESNVTAARIRSQICYMNYVGVYGVCLICPASRFGVCQLASIINASLSSAIIHTKVFVQIRLDISLAQRVKSGPAATDDFYTDSWQQWSDLQLMLKSPSAKYVFVTLELGGDLPDLEEQYRWAGEPVRLMVLPTACFLANEKQYPVLTAAYQRFIDLLMCSSSTSFVISGEPVIKTMNEHIQYLNHLISGQKQETPFVVRHTEDLIQHPLQPLRDNLEAATYEVFERDPIKYETYRMAILNAMEDKKLEKGNDLVVLVVGAGRGPLVTASVFCAEDANVRMTIYVVEKNVNAVPALMDLKKNKWDKSRAVVSVQIFNQDMRNFVSDRKADIVVSELLGSFSDNELSPECLDGVYRSVHPNAISIPQEYTSHLRPVMSSKLVNNVLALIGKEDDRTKLLEGNYVVNMRNVFFPCDTQPLFQFDHKNLAIPPEQRDNRRFRSLTFTSELDYVCHGFSGYFDTVLYKTHRLSIQPDTHSQGMFSWFPIFFPLVQPIPVKAHQKLTVNFWRCVSPTHVWYEFSVSEPFRQPIQNSGGCSASIGL